jgi:VRR-NUC domain-containing protein
VPFARERDLLNWIIATAEATGWQVFHVPAPMTAARGGGFVGSKRAAGLPDLFLLHDDPPRMIIAEVKGPNGELSARQEEFLRLARDVAEVSWTPLPTGMSRLTIGVYAWTPTDEKIIEQILRTKVLR